MIVANWKMNQSLEEIESFFQSLSDLSQEAWVAPQFIHLPLCLKLGKLPIGAQNCSAHDKGAWTGEVSPQALKELGVHFVILGHSERRQHFGESNQLINTKIKKAQENNLEVIYCVGESLEEREAGQTQEIIRRQVQEGLEGVALKGLTIAYEPVWAIGSGKAASPEMAQETHALIKELATVKVLYGGSVKPENCQGFFGQPDIDGALVGGASLKATSFNQLCQ